MCTIPPHFRLAAVTVGPLRKSTWVPPRNFIDKDSIRKSVPSSRLPSTWRDRARVTVGQNLIWNKSRTESSLASSKNLLRPRKERKGKKKEKKLASAPELTSLEKGCGRCQFDSFQYLIGLIGNPLKNENVVLPGIPP